MSVLCATLTVLRRQVFDHIYQSGGRRFVLLNEAPLQLSPVYAAVSSGGAGNNQYWQNKTLYNQTEYQHKMMEYTTSVNTMFDYGVPFHLVVKKRWPGAAVAIFDVHRLLTDMHNSPASYLDAPANATGAYRNCAPTNSSGSLNCANSKSPMSSFLWCDRRPFRCAGWPGSPANNRPAPGTTSSTRRRKPEASLPSTSSTSSRGTRRMGPATAGRQTEAGRGRWAAVVVARKCDSVLLGLSVHPLLAGVPVLEQREHFVRACPVRPPPATRSLHVSSRTSPVPCCSWLSAPPPPWEALCGRTAARHGAERRHTDGRVGGVGGEIRAKRTDTVILRTGTGE